MPSPKEDTESNSSPASPTCCGQLAPEAPDFQHGFVPEPVLLAEAAGAPGVFTGPHCSWECTERREQFSWLNPGNVCISVLSGCWGSGGCPENSLENTSELSPTAQGRLCCARLGVTGGEQDEGNGTGKSVPNITMRSPSFCIGPCPAQTFCICKNLALFPFSWAASSSFTAGLEEAQNSPCECWALQGEGQSVTGTQL